MSEAMSSVEIEDVLSSIRRLVSEDFRPGLRGGRVIAADDKLILTPALRVVADPADAVAPPLPRLHLGVEPVIEELVASLEQAVEAQGLDWESEVGDPMPVSVVFEWTSAARSHAAAAKVIASDAAPQTDTPTWNQEDPGHQDSQQAPDAVAPLEAEPDHDAEIASNGSDWLDQAEAEVVASLDTEMATDAASATAANPALDDNLFADPPGEMTFDEDVLRDLVRDLIREELQGGFGERITRNIRKLVRAEIARALAAQDFD